MGDATWADPGIGEDPTRPGGAVWLLAGRAGEACGLVVTAPAWSSSLTHLDRPLDPDLLLHPRLKLVEVAERESVEGHAELLRRARAVGFRKGLEERCDSVDHVRGGDPRAVPVEPHEASVVDYLQLFPFIAKPDLFFLTQISDLV